MILLSDISNYTPPAPSLWQGRKDSLPDERYFQRIDCIDVRKDDLPKENETVLLGFCSDEGVRRNLGRVGAQSGPDTIRQQLAKLACHNAQRYTDIGNITCSNQNLESAQAEFSRLISYSHEHGKKTVALGGGHEIAWAHFRGLADHYSKLGIINFDAHFDIRPLQNNQCSSGTPFFQIKEFCDEQNKIFDYCCLGIQAVANTRSLFERADKWGISYLTAEQITKESLAWQQVFLDDFLLRHNHIYLTVCLDVFDECYAPGVSAPQALGITPWQAMPLLKYIRQSGKVVGIDIAELSPPLDINQKTARLGAVILAEYFTKNELFN